MSAGADPRFSGDAGDTPLRVAAWYGNLRIAHSLLRRGVPPSGANYHGETALMAASQTCLDGKMVQVLLDAGANPNARDDDGSAALMSAAFGGNPLAAERLIRAGADPEAKNTYGDTAESESCSRSDRGHVEVCILVRDALGKKSYTK